MSDDAQTLGRAAYDALQAGTRALANLRRPVTGEDWLLGRRPAVGIDFAALERAGEDVDALLASVGPEFRVHLSGTPPTVVDVPLARLRKDLAALLDAVEPLRAV